MKKGEIKAQKAAVKKEKRQGVKRNTVEAQNMASSCSKKNRVNELEIKPNEDAEPSTCCMCFVRYEDELLQGAGTEWISRASGRWLPEACAEGCVADDQGCTCNMSGHCYCLSCARCISRK